MALMYEEVMILLEENVCKLFEYTNFHEAPSNSLSKLVEETESRYIFAYHLYILFYFYFKMYYCFSVFLLNRAIA